MFCAGTLDETVVLLLLCDSISSLILPFKSYLAFLCHSEEYHHKRKGTFLGGYARA